MTDTVVPVILPVDVRTFFCCQYIQHPVAEVELLRSRFATGHVNGGVGAFQDVEAVAGGRKQFCCFLNVHFRLLRKSDSASGIAPVHAGVNAMIGAVSIPGKVSPSFRQLPDKAALPPSAGHHHVDGRL